VNDDVRGINDLIQLVPNPLALAFTENGFSSACEVSIVCDSSLANLLRSGVSAQQLLFLEPV
jgi:hypothetical protein